MIRDFKNMRRWTEADEISMDLLMTQLAAGASLIIAAIALFIVLTIDPVSADITGATTDNLISDDMASYTEIYGHAAIFEEGDME